MEKEGRDEIGLRESTRTQVSGLYSKTVGIRGTLRRFYWEEYMSSLVQNVVVGLVHIDYLNT